MDFLVHTDSAHLTLYPGDDTDFSKYINHAGYHLVSKKMRPTEAGKTWQHKVGDYYIYSNTSNSQKIADLKKISKALNLALIIEEIKPTKKYPL